MPKAAQATAAGGTGASIADIYQAMEEENEINRANTIAKLTTMGPKAAKDIVG
ncbi:hypothetical protein [Burkholderia sp. MSMB1826]|uniref:hypothetical protein n=1 Tax=Burkholderia sp. MSMB1826 TaxID=1637875 RepID=UPI000AA0BAED|nr:hypothetical protein [Burkholderia sp. MSMB1826]